jgi:hypothetical protein
VEREWFWEEHARKRGSLPQGSDARKNVRGSDAPKSIGGSNATFGGTQCTEEHQWTQGLLRGEASQVNRIDPPSTEDPLYA